MVVRASRRFQKHPICLSKPFYAGCRKRIKYIYSQFEACYKWLINAKYQRIPISGAMLKAKALYFAKEFGDENFSASDGWFHQWKKRHNVSMREESGMSYPILYKICFTSDMFHNAYVYQIHVFQVFHVCFSSSSFTTF